ncbi:hypothetical protein PVAP13_1KG200300 [Panicum virgatum]|uniref:Expansin n=1 Tax=Panicum virgatum TaxID=38727 RepID=A0A8T0XK28_PANVG|nr:hypothetical protein PVAP13_1KG200300 [Panicum virgatum]
MAPAPVFPLLLVAAGWVLAMATADVASASSSAPAPTGWLRAHATFYGGADASGTMVDPTWCKPGVTVTVTATNFCPPNYGLPGDNGGWCNPPRPHFDMAQPAWEKIGVYRAGIIPVVYRRVPCVRRGGVRFMINGHDYFNLVLVSNVAMAGSIKSMEVKAGDDSTDCMPMARNWHSMAFLTGKMLSFRVTNTDGQTLELANVVPQGWKFGQTFASKLQFS